MHRHDQGGRAQTGATYAGVHRNTEGNKTCQHEIIQLLSLVCSYAYRFQDTSIAVKIGK